VTQHPRTGTPPGRRASTGRGLSASRRRPARATAAGVVLAGGSGTRFDAGENKVYLPLAGRSIVSWALNALAAVPDVDPLLLVVRPQDQQQAQWVIDREVDRPAVELVSGGATRQESELNALRHLAGRIDAGRVDIVVIHDAARPLAHPTLAAGVIHAARQHGGAFPAEFAEDLAAVDADGLRVHDQRLSTAVRVQTPQAFAAAPLLAAYEAAARAQFVGPDTAETVRRFSELSVHWIAGDPTNLKITHPQDLLLAEAALATANYRIS
jgi:2-C-methyl-D-erythritol 4-phosphate cytidylyltransferase